MGKLADLRLLAVAEMIRHGSVVADIGADHGRLICYLVEEGIAVQGYACDIGERPLATCAKTVARRGLQNKIELRLTDGLKGLPLGKIDDIIIAGIGGDVITRILEAAPQAKDSRLRFILQPMTRPERLRKSLYRMGYAIERERGAEAGGFVYTVMKVLYTGEIKNVDELFALTGLLPGDDGAPSRKLMFLTARRLKKAAESLAGARGYEEKVWRYGALSSAIDKMLREED